MNRTTHAFELERVSLADLPELRKMSIKTFIDAFSSGTSAENMKKYVDSALSVEKLTVELQQADSQFYFGVLNNIRVGYLKLNFRQAQTELKEPTGMEIERIYVLSEHQGKKIGQSFMDKAFSIARENRMKYMWLGVWEKNTGAIAFYKRHGFEEFSAHAFMMGTEEQTDLLLKHYLV
jgi:ribosomal protein S18 acetylase RimI-like enzyme